ncbi:regulatory protein RecX [Psychromicrobium lacuslunae]|uniref:regulatory protein RecX n=1 Tax=Psychromicrobium lacuslunae TaxID=1618207 RepID=UPI0005D3EBDD|nr:regulatory protein RecX [Psychromicrobium lacuslunae]
MTESKKAVRRGRTELDPEADPESVARAIVLRQLTSSAKTRHQLAEKLAERRVPSEAAEAVLNRFEDVKLIDDAEFAMLWVRSRAQSRSLARSALRRELREKGVAQHLAEAALEQLDDNSEREAAAALVRRKLRPGRDLSEPVERDKELRRLVAMLARKGYSPGLAFAVASAELENQSDRGPDF